MKGDLQLYQMLHIVPKVEHRFINSSEETLAIRIGFIILFILVVMLVYRAEILFVLTCLAHL